MFYLKLAINNIKNSLGTFAPFLLASLVLYVMLGSTLLLRYSTLADGMELGPFMLGLASIVLVIFALIMEIYSFNFLVKQRAKEFGLYTILGMRKTKVGLIASLELGFIVLGLILIGSLINSGFSNLFFLIFARLANYDQFQFRPSLVGYFLTALIFLGIFFLLMILACLKVGTSSPLTLFVASKSGEKEPRGNVLLAILSLIFLGAGYGLSLSSRKIAALAVLSRFFVAVILVILGTYLFYISFIAWFLKRCRTNKTYFYQPEHFINTSQMIFRMKQHATGLANITLLATMAFVTIAVTSSLYGGITSKIDLLYPREASALFQGNSRAEVEEAYQAQLVEPLGSQPDQLLASLSTTLAFNIPDAKHLTITQDSLQEPSAGELSFVVVLTQDDFRSFGNDLPKLEKDQVAFWLKRQEIQLETIDFLGLRFDKTIRLKDITLPETVNLYGAAALVVSDDQVMDDLVRTYRSAGEFRIGDQGSYYNYTIYFDASQEELDILEKSLVDGKLQTKSVYYQSAMDVAGGFLFVGFLLSIAFLLGAALIIYYKQYSEGMEDKASYRILQEVGMSAQAVRKTINSQILTALFLPLLFAILHFIMSLTMVKQLLLQAGIQDNQLIYSIRAAAILAIILIYLGIYRLTSKVYYRMIERC